MLCARGSMLGQISCRRGVSMSEHDAIMIGWASANREEDTLRGSNRLI